MIAFETMAAEAERDKKPFAHHLAHLAVHGYLHLLGHDHESDHEADAMERLETEILGDASACPIRMPATVRCKICAARGSNPEKPCLTPIVFVRA